MINEESDIAFEIELAEFNLHLLERYKERVMEILGENIPASKRNEIILSLLRRT